MLGKSLLRIIFLNVLDKIHRITTGTNYIEIQLLKYWVR